MEKILKQKTLISVSKQKWSENYRRKHPDRIKDSNRRWFSSKKGKATRKRYLSKLKVKKASLKSKKGWIDRNPDKWKAHQIVNNAIRDGKLKRKVCEKCGKKKSQAHHDDYSKPLKIRWLCSFHHAEIHASH